VVDDRGLDDDASLELLLHRAPLALETGTTQRENRVALLRLWLEHIDENDVTDRQLRLALGVTPVELAVADDAFGLCPDVDEDLVLVDADNRAFDDVAVLEALDIGVLLGEQLLHRGGLRTELADRDRLLFLVLTGGGRVGGVGLVQRGAGNRLRGGPLLGLGRLLLDHAGISGGGISGGGIGCRRLK
jgi:hypothetical protein